jgi:hypothetical protein
MKLSVNSIFSVLSLCVFSLNALSQENAHTYVCTAIAGAGVEHSVSGDIQANVYDVSLLKLKVSKAENGWQVFEGNDDEPILTGCETQYRCFPKGAFFSIFQMTKNHVFTYVIQKAYEPDLSRQIIYSFKGSCLIQKPS